MYNPQPEPNLLILLDPQARYGPGTVGQQAQRDVNRLVADHAFSGNPDPDRIAEVRRIGQIERQVWSSSDVFEQGISDSRDQIGRDANALQPAQMPSAPSTAPTLRGHRHDLVIDAGKPALGLGNQLSRSCRSVGATP